MDFGYFHEEESEQFAFYRIPRVLFKDDIAIARKSKVIVTTLDGVIGL